MGPMVAPLGSAASTPKPRMSLSESAVGSWLRQLHQEGRRAPKPHGRGFRSILDEDDGAVLRSLVRDKNDGTLEGICASFPGQDWRRNRRIKYLPGLEASRARHKERPCGRANSRDLMSLPNARSTAKTWPGWIRRAWCSLTRPGS